MGKINNDLLQLSGTIYNITHVNTRNQGSIVRAKRGTYTPVVINDVMKARWHKTRQYNNTAKAVHDIIKMYSSGFKQSDLWQVILKRFNSQSTDGQPAQLAMLLNDLEINSNYPFHRLSALPVLTVEDIKDQLLVKMQTIAHPVFKGIRANCYYYSLIAIFPGTDSTADHYFTDTEWISMAGELPRFELVYPRPADAACYLLLLGINAGFDGVAIDQYQAMAMKITVAGIL